MPSKGGRGVGMPSKGGRGVGMPSAISSKNKLQYSILFCSPISPRLKGQC